MQAYMKGIEYLHRPFERNAKILVALITRNLGFMHIEPLGQFPL